MSNWEDYKNTFINSEDAFTLARAGDTHQLNEYLNSNVGVDINEKNHKGYSPLMISVYNGNYEASLLLLEKGADPNSSDLSGNTVLMGAAFKGDVALVTILIKFGSRKDMTNLNGLTAEEWASAFGRKDVVSLLKQDNTISRFKNMMNAIKIIWGFVNPKTQKEATV